MGKACAESIVPKARTLSRTCHRCGHRLCFSVAGMVKRRAPPAGSEGSGDNVTVAPSPQTPTLMRCTSQPPLYAIEPTHVGAVSACAGRVTPRCACLPNRPGGLHVGTLD